jgi:hypothetical protein
VLEASVTGLDPSKPYVLALSNEASDGGALQSLQGFMTNPAGAGSSTRLDRSGSSCAVRTKCSPATW